MKFILARKLWENGQFVGDCATQFPIQCEKIAGNSPQYGWLVPVGGCCGGGEGYQLTMQNPVPAATEDASLILANAAGILRGVFVEYDGSGALYDAETVADITDACNACCDVDPAPTVTPRYNGTFPAVANITDTTWTVVRTDNGTQLDFQRAMLDYLGQYTEGTFKRTSYAGGNSTYTFSSNKPTVTKVGSDTLTETARTFDSNSLAAPGAGNHYIADITVDGTPLASVEDDAYNAISDLVTFLNGSATYNIYGTWSAASASVLRLSSTTVNVATIVLTSAAD